MKKKQNCSLFHFHERYFAMKSSKEAKSAQTNLAVYTWVLAISILTGYSNSSFATITQIQDANKCSSPCWEISGQITKSDLQELARAVNIMSGTKANPTFRLHSNGGDVEVAIAIGRQLRKFHATAAAWDQGGCYSSCVFIFAGAVQRMAGSASIGIHRPYSSSTELRDYQTIQNDQRRLAKLAKDYLEEVNVLPSLYDAMVSIPPEKIKMLSEVELQQYGLLQVDPAEQELWDTANARKHGLTKVEFMRRKTQINITCAAEYKRMTRGDGNGYFKCYEDVLSGRR